MRNCLSPVLICNIKINSIRTHFNKGWATEGEELILRVLSRGVTWSRPLRNSTGTHTHRTSPAQSAYDSFLKQYITFSIIFSSVFVAPLSKIFSSIWSIHNLPAINEYSFSNKNSLYDHFLGRFSFKYAL